MYVAAIVLAIALAGTLYFDHAGKPVISGVCKMIASTAFMAAAWIGGAMDSFYGKAIFVGLFLSWWGDLLLIFKDKRPFLAGLVAFLAAHLAYIAAFFGRGVHPFGAAMAVVVLMPFVWIIVRWLKPHLSTEMKGPVYAYMVVISSMLVLSVGAWRAGGALLIPCGALAFYLSDLSVAKERFVSPGYLNRLWGLPMYFLGQILLAFSIASST
ncbi:MAG: lysoplasmalogenase [Candidatus Hydrogenedentes bacterium]|nr:lysoplasmalogenase [Candidatus Hydrogenedentota bacterium]